MATVDRKTSELARATAVNDDDLIPIVQSGVTKAVEVQNLLGGAVNVGWFGAVGDGVTVDTTAIQAAIDALKALGGGELRFGAGQTYMTGSLNIFAGLHIKLNGATVKLIPNQADFARVFRNAGISGYQYTGSVDSNPFIVEGGILDGNRANQGTYTGYELEHHALVCVSAASNSTGKFVVKLRDLIIKESAGDGINLAYNSRVAIENVTTWNCFRGGVTVSGGGHALSIKKCSSGGDVHDFAINVEPTSTPGNEFDLFIDNYSIGSGFDVDLQNTAAGNVYVRGLKMTGYQFHLTGKSDGKFVFEDSIIRMGTTTTSDEVRTPYDLTFTRCKFTAVDSPEAGTNYALRINWDNAAGQNARFRQCAFAVDASVEGADTTYGINQPSQGVGNESTLLVEDCKFTGFDYGVLMRGGNVIFRNCEADSHLLHCQGSSGTELNAVTVEGRQALSSTKAVITQSGSAVPVAIRYVNHEVDGGDGSAGGGENTLSFTGFTNVTKLWGRRRIYVTAAPTGGALAGDIAINNAPAAGAAGAWVATTDSNTAATWKVAYTLAG